MKKKKKIVRKKKEVKIEVLPELPEVFLPETMLEPIATTRSNNEGLGLLENTLQSEIEQEHHVKSVSKELFNKDNIDLKTEVSHDEINQVTKIRFLEDKFKIDNVDILLKSFLKLRVSKKRQSRREFIDALQTENRNSQGGSFMSRLFGRGDNNP